MIVSYYSLGFPIETRTSKDYKVVYFRLIDYDAKNFIFSEAVRFVLFNICITNESEI